MMKEEYHRIRESLDISGVSYENTGGTQGSRKTDTMAAISKLTDDNEREVLRRWYLMQQSEEKIRNEMGYSQSMIYEFRKRGFKHLETSE